MNKYIIELSTNWCGMDQKYSAIAEKESDLYDIAQELAYENFSSYDCITYILEELFDLEDGEDYTQDQYDEAYKIENEYFDYNIKEFIDDDDWNDYELIYDACTDFLFN